MEKKIFACSFSMYCDTDICAEDALPDSQLCANCMYGKLTVVLDLDETLVYTNQRSIPFKTSPFCSYNRYLIYKRPYLATFLQKLFEHYDVCIWTAATEKYANFVIGQILKVDQVPFRILTRKDTVLKQKPNYYYWDNFDKIKPLSRIREDLSRIVMVDDNSSSFQENSANGILIEAFTNPDEQQFDIELHRVLEQLKLLSLLKDVREK